MTTTNKQKKEQEYKLYSSFAETDAGKAIEARRREMYNRHYMEVAQLTLDEAKQRLLFAVATGLGIVTAETQLRHAETFLLDRQTSPY
jgi:hypothetical protein